MKQTLKIYIPIMAILIIAGLWLFFWRTLPKSDFSLNSKPLISVDYLSKKNIPNEKEFEKTEKLEIAGQILSIDKPEIKQAELIANNSYSKFSDYNLIIGNERNQFFATATIKDVGTYSNNFISKILEDKHNQKFLTIYPNQIYQIYFQLESDFYYLPTGVIINNVRYPITATENGFYKVSNFQSLDMTSVGVKPENDHYNIAEAVFITDRVKQKNVINRITSSNTKNPLNRSGNVLNIDIVKNDFVLLQSGGGVYLKSMSSPNSQSLQVPTNSYANTYSNILLKVNLTDSNTLLLISSGGDYKIKNSVVDKRLSWLVILNLLLIACTLCISSWSFTLGIFDKLFNYNKVLLEKLKSFFCHNMFGLSIVGVLMILLLMLQSSHASSDYLSTTNRFTILFLLLIYVIKFDLKYMVPTLILLTTVEAVFYQIGFTSIAEKVGKIILSLISVIVFSLMFLSKKSNKNITNAKK